MWVPHKQLSLHKPDCPILIVRPEPDPDFARTTGLPTQLSQSLLPRHHANCRCRLPHPGEMYAEAGLSHTQAQHRLDQVTANAQRPPLGQSWLPAAAGILWLPMHRTRCTPNLAAKLLLACQPSCIAAASMLAFLPAADSGSRACSATRPSLRITHMVSRPARRSGPVQTSAAMELYQLAGEGELIGGTAAVMFAITLVVSSCHHCLHKTSLYLSC